mmetsp:Transcript_49179/g.96413  ORF Transcript_49179/g.96413 Transcript_49179/m.96413 type:complete len:91 (+) Transcript_49179:827-1099(+)
MFVLSASLFSACRNWNAARAKLGFRRYQSEKFKRPANRAAKAEIQIFRWRLCATCQNKKTKKNTKIVGSVHCTWQLLNNVLQRCAFDLES